MEITLITLITLIVAVWFLVELSNSIAIRVFELPTPSINHHLL